MSYSFFIFILSPTPLAPTQHSYSEPASSALPWPSGPASSPSSGVEKVGRRCGGTAASPPTWLGMAGAAWDGGGGKGEWAAGPGRQEEGDGERDKLVFFAYRGEGNIEQDS